MIELHPHSTEHCTECAYNLSMRMQEQAWQKAYEEGAASRERFMRFLTMFGIGRSKPETDAGSEVQRNNP